MQRLCRHYPGRWSLLWWTLGIVWACSSDAPPGPCAQVEAGEERLCANLHQMQMPQDLPPSVGNPFADNLAAANVGYMLFFDSRLSKQGAIRCATCHAPELHFTDGKPVGVGLRVLERNTIGLLSAAASPYYFWDGRSASLWLAPLVALEAHEEMALDTTTLQQILAKHYQSEIVALQQQMPSNGSAALVLTGRLLEAYLRQAAGGPSKFDDYLAGNDNAIDEQAKAGLRTFLNQGCATCHGGPWLTDWQFRKLEAIADPLDPGYSRGLQLVQEELQRLQMDLDQESNEGLTDFFAQPAIQAMLQSTSTAQEAGAFRTPSLRDVMHTGPYGHDGRWQTLPQAMKGHFFPQREIPVREPLNAAKIESIISFLRTLDSTPRFDTTSPPDYWSWPYR